MKENNKLKLIKINQNKFIMNLKILKLNQNNYNNKMKIFFLILKLNKLNNKKWNLKFINYKIRLMKFPNKNFYL